MDRSGVRQVPEGSGEQGKMEKTGGKMICVCPNDPRGKGIDDDDDDDDADDDVASLPHICNQSHLNSTCPYVARFIPLLLCDLVGTDIPIFVISS